MITELNVGDSVVVKSDVVDPDLNVNMGGWQGRVTEVDLVNELICVAWDSLTLQQMSEDQIAEMEIEGMSWTEMYLYPTDVDLTSPRDTHADVEEAAGLIGSKHGWGHLGEEGIAIQAVVNNADDDSDWAYLEAWQKHLNEKLSFPFKAEVVESDFHGSLSAGHTVKVLGFAEIEEDYGILVALERQLRRYVLPLCDLEVVDNQSANYEPVQLYSLWFANR